MRAGFFPALFLYAVPPLPGAKKEYCGVFSGIPVQYESHQYDQEPLMTMNKENKQPGRASLHPGNERLPQYDLIRVIAMMFVIMIHVPDHPFADIPLLENAAMTILLLCNPFFYLISGRFNLSRSFETKEDYRQFYRRKAVTVLLPFVFATFALCGASLVAKGEFSVLYYLRYTYRFFMNENNDSHLWFLYPLTGFLLATPFLSKMLHAMQIWEMKLLLLIGLAWNTVSIYLTANIGVGFAFSGWILSGLIIYYVGGYLLKNFNTDKMKKMLYPAGLIGFVITVIGKTCFAEHFHSPTSLSPAFVLFGFAAYVFMENEIAIRSKWLPKLLSRIAPLSFWVYLFHMAVLNHIVMRFTGFGPVWLRFGSRFLLTLLLSLALGFVLDALLMKRFH